jgi:hypothetical protein
MTHAIFSKLSKYLLLSDEGKQNFHKYDALKKHEGWIVHQGFLIEIMNEISTYMLDGEFTKLEKEEKDVQQRAFFMVKEIVDFLLNPLRNAERYVALKEATNKRQAKSPERKKSSEPKT